MQQFNFRVVSAADEEEDVPVSVAGQVMMDVQRLITHTGELLVRQELRTQSRLQDGIGESFTLRMQGQGAGPRRDGDLLEDTLGRVCAELDRTNLSSLPPEVSSTHIEAACRRDIAGDILALSDHLDGYIMSYGTEGAMRRFRMNAREALEREASADVSSMVSAVIGVVSRDPQRKGRWLISNGIDTAPVTFSDSLPREDVESYPSQGPLIVTGRVVTDGEGRLAEVRDVTDAYVFPVVKFHRVITPDRDLSLLNPVLACPGYRPDRGLWTLENDDLGISVSKPSWDEAVWAFHEYFMFLWETYAETEDDFEGEEREVSDFLRSLAFPRRPSAGQPQFNKDGHMERKEHHGQEAHIAERPVPDRGGAHIQAARPGLRGSARGEAGPLPPLCGARQEDQRQDEGPHAEGPPVLPLVPGADHAGHHGQGPRRGAHGAHDMRAVRRNPSQAVHQGAIT